MKSFVLVALAAVACGGSRPQVSEPTPGEQHATAPPSAPAPDQPAPAPGETAGPRPEAPPGEAIAVPPTPVEGTVIELKNEAEVPLNFGTTKGWGPVVFAYTGKPPKAKSVILFESACTASCDSPPDAVCPDCPEPATKKEEQAMARIETAAAGESLKVPWDGKIRVYEKAAGKKCKCFRKADPPADSYTIKACGLRPPKVPGKPSRPVCAETVVTLGPGATNPPAITLSFPK